MEIKAGTGKTELTYIIRCIGDDIEITIGGGDVHIGSVAVVFDNEVTVLTAKGHKDNFLTEPMAKAMAAHFHCRAVIFGGFHLDDISKEDIAEVLKVHEKAIGSVIAFLKESI